MVRQLRPGAANHFDAASSHHLDGRASVPDRASSRFEFTERRDMHRRLWLSVTMLVAGASLLVATSLASAAGNAPALKQGGVFKLGTTGASTQVDPQLAYVTTAW